jgi:hypothetical protein
LIHLQVAFMTAGYPTRDDTVPLLLALQAGGADVVELGVPFTDPQADGTTIQRASEVCVFLCVESESSTDVEARVARLIQWLDPNGTEIASPSTPLPFTIQHNRSRCRTR